MSIIQSDSIQHSPGYWVGPASRVAESFTNMLFIGPDAVTHVLVGDCQDIDEFFYEVAEAIGEGAAIHLDTYRVAIRVLCFCHHELVFFGGEATLGKLEMELGVLAERFCALMTGQSSFSDEEFDEVLRLVTFLDRLGTLEPKLGITAH